MEVETGSASSSSESYASVGFADAYVSSYMNGDVNWTSASTSEKENALRIATSWLDTHYRYLWVGLRRSRTQALAWPRIDAFDEDGYVVQFTTIPLALQRATVEVAVRSLDPTLDIEPDARVEDQGITARTDRLDVLSQSIKYSGPKPTEPYFARVERLLSGILRGSGSPVFRG